MQRDLEFDRLSLTQYTDPHGVADPVVVEPREQFTDAVDGLAVDGRDDVARNDFTAARDADAGEAGFGCTGIGRDAQDNDAGNVEELGQPPIEVFVDFDAERRAQLALKRIGKTSPFHLAQP